MRRVMWLPLLAGRVTSSRGAREGNEQIGDRLGLGFCLCVHQRSQETHQQGMCD